MCLWMGERGIEEIGMRIREMQVNHEKQPLGCTLWISGVFLDYRRLQRQKAEAGQNEDFPGFGREKRSL